MLLDLTDPEKSELIDLVLREIERSKPSPGTDLLHSILAKLGAEAAAEPIDPAEPLDEAVLIALRDLRREGRPDVLSMVVRLFLDSAPSILKELEAAAAGTDAAMLLSISHKMRGISANVGARLLAARCTQLEAAARMGSVPENAAAEVEAIAREYRRADAALMTWISVDAATVPS
jgi:HPt (histidine-containing phosphotransfer) domain-containing protein